MQVLKKEFGLYRLRVDSEDDLWTLARICVIGRSIGMLGERRDQTTAGQEGGRAAANEVISEGLAGDILSEHAFVKETSLLDEAWRRISTDGAVAYGKEMIEKSLNEGAIETLLISADVLRDSDWEAITNGLSEIGANLIQCSTDHDAGEQLLGMGGAVALLRFKV